MTKTQICNLALARIGNNPISSLDEDMSKEGKLMKQIYPSVLQETLRACNWGFARRRRLLNLVALGGNEIARFDYVYLLPADCLYVRSLYLDGGAELKEYEIFTDRQNRRLISAACDGLCLEYTADIQDSTLFDSQFIDVLVCNLAFKTVFNLSGNAELMMLMSQEYNMKLGQASASSENETRRVAKYKSAYTECRNG